MIVGAFKDRGRDLDDHPLTIRVERASFRIYTCDGHNLGFFPTAKRQEPGDKKQAVKRQTPAATLHAPCAQHIKRRGAVLSPLALKSQMVTVASIIIFREIL
ncbi:MAG: hypothetical protein GY859_39750 [Desulfobacterales bacterium]|nr:hypothetical protein [Desulfobacterales bacterium]